MGITQEPITVSLKTAEQLTDLRHATLKRLCITNQVKHVRLQNGESGRNTYLIFYSEIQRLLKAYTPTTEKPKRKPGRPSVVQL